MCVCVCAAVVVGTGNIGLCPLQAEKKNDLFNTLREHLTLNLCETVPDRNTMENKGTKTKSWAERRRRRRGQDEDRNVRERRVGEN